MADGQVRINTSLNNSKLEKGLKDSESKIRTWGKSFGEQVKYIKQVETEIGKLDKQRNSLLSSDKEPAELKKMSAELKSIQADTKAIEKDNASLIASYEKAVNVLDSLKSSGYKDSQLQPQFAEIDKLAEQLQPVWKQLDESGSKAKILAAAMEQIKLHPETSQEAQELKTRIDALGGTLSEAKYEADDLRQKIDFERAIVNTREMGTTALSTGKKIASIGQSAIKGLGSLASYAMRGAKALGSVALNLLGIGKNSNSAANGIGKLGIRFSQLLKNAFVFSVISSGFRKMREMMTDLMHSNAEMSASLNAIQVNLWTAFAPIWEVVEPALISLLHILQQVTAALATFFAMLGGKTYQQAKDNAKALSAQAKATKAVGKASSDATKSVQSFDQLNKQSKNSGGGGGGGAPDFNAVEPPNFGWIDELKDALGDWYKIGEFLSDKLTDFLNNIDWKKIQNGAKTIATNISDFINGFLDDPALWQAVGHTIAQGLNTALIFADTLITGLNWKTFGENFAKVLNTFTQEFDWNLLGKSIGDGINAALGFMLAAVTEFNWIGLGVSISDSINTLFSTVNWAEVGLTFSGFFKGVIDLIYTVLKETDWKAIGESIGEFLRNIDWNGIIEGVFSIIREAFNGFKEFLQGIFGDDLGAIIANAIVIVGALAAAFTVLIPVVTGVAAAIAFLTSPIGLVVAGIAVLIAIIVALIVNWDSVKTAMVNAWKTMVEVWGTSFASIKGIYDGLVQMFQGLIQFISGVFTGNWQQAWNGILTFFKGIWNTVVSIVESAVNVINTAINGVISGLNMIPGVDIKAKFSSVSIPRFADGALVYGDTLAVVGDNPNAINDPEVIAPLSKLNNMIASALSNFTIDIPDVQALVEKGKNQNHSSAASSTVQSTSSNLSGNNEIISLLRELITVNKAGHVIEQDGQVVARTTSRGQSALSRQFGQAVVPT